MSDRQTFRVEYSALALDAIHHGAGTKGNTVVLRTQDTLDPSTGTFHRVPFVSGNSIKHLIRAAGVQFALDAMGVDRLPNKAVVDLLFSGGHLGKGGVAVKLDEARRLQALFPILSLCGYSAGNQMATSRLAVSHLHLVCAENAWRVPPSRLGTLPPGIVPNPATLPALAMRAGAMRATEFGTRHEATRAPSVMGLLPEAEQAALVAATSKGAGKEETGSSQMIYDWEVIKPGSILTGGFHLMQVSRLELAAFKAALTQWSTGRGPHGGLLVRLGAKGNSGHGTVELFLAASRLGYVVAAEAVPTAGIVPTSESATGDRDVDDLLVHLRDNREAILAALAEAVV